MTFDATKLTPAPWTVAPSDTGWMIPQVYGNNRDDIEFVALARAAFDVLMRRPWGVECIFWGDGVRQFQAVDECDRPVGDTQATDPFTALVEADRWYAANVEVS